MKKTILILAACAAAFTANAQSILTESPETPAQRTARETVASVQATRTVLIGQLRDGVTRLWSSPDPQGALDLLGSHSAEVVGLYQSLIGYLQTVLGQAGDTQGLAEIAAISAKVPPLTVHPDGTVTALPFPSPVPSPVPSPTP
ncbi:MAG: hypothetical protein WCO94_03495 [Verrucomicrobiota bacterium]